MRLSGRQGYLKECVWCSGWVAACCIWVSVFACEVGGQGFCFLELSPDQSECGSVCFGFVRLFQIWCGWRGRIVA